MCLATVMAACALAACTKPEALAWEGDCRFVEQTISWHPIEMTVPEGPARTIRLYLRLQQGTGTVWFDSVEAPGLNVVNPSFEEASGNKIADWGQDDVGQTIFVDESRAAYGQRSVRITRTQPGQSRIWQDLRTEAGRAYKIRVWAQWKDISDGTAYGEVYVINPDGSHDGIIASTQRLTGSSQPIVRRWWEVAADGNTARVARCSLTVAQLGTYRLDVPADTSGLNGTAVVELRTGDGRVSRASLSPAEGWQTVSLHAPIDDSAQVTVSVSGNGTVRLATPVLRRPDLVPLPQQLKWLSPSENFALRGEVPIVVPPTASGAQLTGPNWLAREIRQKAAAEVKLVKTDQYEGRAICIGGPLAMQKLQAAGITVPPKPEGYAVAVRHDLVAAAGHDDPGTFYAAITLLWLLQQVGEQTEIIAADVVDFPELPFRGTYGLYGGDLLAAVETCARLKLNAILIEHSDWYRLDNPGVRQKWQKAFELAKAYYIDVIPELQSFGHAGAVLSIDCRCAEAEWVQGEKHVLHGTEPVELARRDVIVTDATRIEVTSEDGKTRYDVNRDFRVIPGQTSWPFSQDHEPWRIARLPAGSIADGETVLVSYDCAPKTPSSYCPNEPRVYEIMRQAIQNTVLCLRPRWLHVGHDEIYRMNADSRCARAGRSNAENLAMELKRLLEFAREVDPELKIMLWADMLNPYHNGKSLHAHDPCFRAAELIPADAFIMNVWFYGPTQPTGVGWQSLKWFAERGFATTGSPWYDTTCAALWGDVCGLARQRAMNCLGALYTSWRDRWEALSTMADHAWHPRPVSVNE